MNYSETTGSRHLNPRAVYDQLLNHEALTRDQLGALTGLTRVAASASVERLVARGLALPVRPEPGMSRGPADKRFALTPTAGYVVGADIRHGDIALATSDLTGHLAATLRVPFEDPDDAASMLHRAVEACLARANADLDRLRRVVMGSPGVIDPRTGDFAFATTLPTWKHTITGDLRQRLGRPVVFENDVNLAAMAEARFGHGKHGTGVTNLAFAWFGAGTGLGLVLGGRLYRGHAGWAGEIGYLPTPLPESCVEADGTAGSMYQLAGTRAIASLAERMGWGSDAAAAVSAAVAAGPAGEPFLADVARRIGAVASAACLLVDPSVLVLDGDYVAAGGDDLLGRIRAEVARISPTPVRIVLPEVHDHPILRGAVQTALDDARDTLFAA